MHSLPNGCYRSKINVYPKNWKTKSASINVDWYLKYRFYDPSLKDQTGKPKSKQVMVKGVNHLRDLKERQNSIQYLLDQETELLEKKGYNPITGQCLAPRETQDYIIDPSTPFIKALEAAITLLSVGPRTRGGIESVVRGMARGAADLDLANTPIDSIRRRHIKQVLERCRLNSKKWSNNRYNQYKAYLQMIYTELVEVEAVDYNVMKDISKKGVARRIRQVLSNKERKAIDEHLASVFPKFRKFIHLFFHSGGRKTELLQLKPRDVDLVKQTYKTMIRKRKIHTEVERTIKTVALPFWKDFLADCPDDHFIFGQRFEPGKTPMGIEMPTKYWRLFVKQKLGISADLYSLKHLNTTETIDALNEEAAAAQNGHTSTAMVVTIYDVKRDLREEQRRKEEHEKLKKVDNGFV